MLGIVPCLSKWSKWRRDEQEQDVAGPCCLIDLSSINHSGEQFVLQDDSVKRCSAVTVFRRQLGWWWGRRRKRGGSKARTSDRKGWLTVNTLSEYSQCKAPYVGLLPLLALLLSGARWLSVAAAVVVSGCCHDRCFAAVKPHRPSRPRLRFHKWKVGVTRIWEASQTCGGARKKASKEGEGERRTKGGREEGR